MERDTSMALVDHLTELRRRILAVVIVLVVTLIGGLFAASYLLDYLKSTPPANTMEWHAFSLWDGVQLYMQVAFVFSLVVTLPFTLYQLWAFVKPGLRPVERDAALRYVPFASILFVVGLLFGYSVVFRMAIYFTSKVNRSMGLTETYGIMQYFQFMFSIVLPVSLLFELPIVVMFLTHIRILNPQRLKKMRRIAYLVLVIIGTTLTPPDFISDISVSVPLILLYEFSVSLSARIYRKQLLKDQQWEEEFYGKSKLVE